MAAAVNELLTLTNAAEAPPLVFWGPTPDDRYVELALEPHRKFTSSDYLMASAGAPLYPK
eukprot:CAMPEP_0172619602 /NCGR_PEP_ID=MMETSP1068-20121228/94932_1 /TAXON_ID=35684 /ORGANISM="Pseudopedinella elastica, Strain CCMP716" /LENGTH=59 /DNA_ID=CAMNT_0013426431 /DNA_START=1 /DNA_END=180 /DNA_ORIENTATION=+